MTQEAFAADMLSDVLDLEDRAQDCFQQGRYQDAIAAAEAALARDPNALTARLIRDLAHKALALSRQVFLAEPSLQPGAPVVLMLSSTGPGNVPHDHLLPLTRFGRIFWFLENDLPKDEGEIPAHDIVFNVVGDIDAAPGAHALALRFAKSSRRPVLNLPDRVDRTSRAGMAALLAGCPNMCIPGVARIARGEDPQASGLNYPLIVRPAGKHGGEGAVLVEGAEQFAAQLPDAPLLYATEFVDYRSPDGWYRKYRVIFVDRKPYPYHLAIGPHWLVHHWTTGMEKDAGRRAEEMRFLMDPVQAIGETLWASLHEIGTRLDLDFGGIDFSVLGDGRLLFFEANATMLVHPEEDQMFAYKNFAVQAITDAFGRMIARAIARA